MTRVRARGSTKQAADVTGDGCQPWRHAVTQTDVLRERVKQTGPQDPTHKSRAGKCHAWRGTQTCGKTGAVPMFGRALSGRFLRSFSAVFQKYNIVLKEVVVRTFEIGSSVYLFWGGKFGENLRWECRVIKYSRTTKLKKDTMSPQFSAKALCSPPRNRGLQNGQNFYYSSLFYIS